MVRFPGFGITGPYSGFRGYGTVMEAVAGHTLVRGYEDADPTSTPPILHGDPNGGAHAAFAVQAALLARELTGEGQLVELAQSEAVIHHLTYHVMDYAMNRRLPAHPGNRHPSMAPHGIYPCVGDDRWIAIAAPSDEAFRALCAVMGQPALAGDARFADAVSRHRNQRELDAILGAWTATGDHDRLMRELQAAGVPAAKLSRQEEMTADPQLAARGFFEALTHAETGTHPYPGPMAKFQRLPLSPVRGPAPRLGEHNRDVLQGLLGLRDEEYRQLEDDRIVGTVYLEEAR
jgi:crotonobetainyl-CoA:carnitine CoA-transferase CaiB-like acyl-CoA transferase